MKIAAVCCTYHRPRQLGSLIKCFLEQDYPRGKRELVILDDAGEYDNQEGDGWRLVSVCQRWPTLGEKRNAAAAMVSPDVDALAVWDDDDLYLPWALRASVAAVSESPWSRPSLVLHEQADGSLRQHETGGLFHGGWAYRREAFDRAGGYLAINNGEDQDLARRMTEAGVWWADPIALGFAPFYIYRLGNAAGYHLSNLGPHGYERLGARARRRSRLVIGWPRDYSRPRIVPGIHKRVF
ncbi:MAG: glycosyltransferase family 2 protein [Pirellulales bacterium]|nr:glycosyltransferase family 2 protein [Pirellulales bacterium]